MDGINGKRDAKARAHLSLRTTADQRQDLLCGAYICAELEDGKYVAKEIGLFCRDGHPEEARVLTALCKRQRF